MKTVRFERVSKKFALPQQRSGSFQELFLGLRHLKLRRSKGTHWVLRDVSMDVAQGEMLGLIGPNGAGKSTVLKLISGIIAPTSGRVAVNGRVGALLELGSGFHPDLTGRENVYLNGAILGLGRGEMRRMYPDIVRFAELERFIDMPVKHYSTGMYMRLGFSIAIHVLPDILLVDEVLAVGDKSFQLRCLDAIERMRRRGVSIVLVTHNLEFVQRMCDRAIWLDQGKIQCEGPVEQVLEEYSDWVHIRDEQELLAEAPVARSEYSDQDGPLADFRLAGLVGPAASRREAHPNEMVGVRDQELAAKLAAGNGEAGPAMPHLSGEGLPAHEGDSILEQQTGAQHGISRRWGSGEAEIVRVQLLDGAEHEQRIFKTGDAFVVRMHYSAEQRLERPQFGLALHHANGFHINGPNTTVAGLDIEAIQGTGHIDYVIDSLPLLEGTYFLSVALYDHAGQHAYDHHHQLYRFRVHPSDATGEKYGTIVIPSRWNLSQSSKER